MKYLRRTDIDSVTRIEIAVQAYVGKGVYGTITKLSKIYEVSRLFIYKLLWELQNLYSIDKGKATDKGEAKRLARKEIDRNILLYKMAGKSSLESIGEILKAQGYKYNSQGYIWARLKVFGEALPENVGAGVKVKYYLSDEIFAQAEPILVTVEPQSLAILKIAKATKRDAETWEAHWQALTSQGYGDKQYVVSDLAKGIVKACGNLGMTHHPDLFHLLHPLAVIVARFEQQA